MKGIWIKNQTKYSSGENYKIGKIEVGAWFNPLVSKGEPTIYRAQINLPGMKMNEGTIDFDDAEHARNRVESAIATWFKWLEH